MFGNIKLPAIKKPIIKTKLSGNINSIFNDPVNIGAAVGVFESLNEGVNRGQSCCFPKKRQLIQMLADFFRIHAGTGCRDEDRLSAAGFKRSG